MQIFNNKKHRSHSVLRNRLLIVLAVLVMALSLASAQTRTKGEAPQTQEELPDANDFVAVEEQPTALYREPVKYPDEARKKGIEGTVWIRVLIDKEGKPRDAVIIKDSGHDVGFEKATLEAAMKGKWKPAIQGKKPIAVWVSYKVVFELTEEKESRELPDTNDFVPVEEMPILIHRETPIYPYRAQKTGFEGTVWIKVLIDKEGTPRDAVIMKDSGCNIGFEEAALEAAMKGKWKPAIQKGKPVAVWVSYKVNFRFRN